VPLSPAYVAGVIPYRGEVLTTLSLRALLGGAQGMPGGCVLVLDDEETGELLGLMVDAVSGVVTVRESMLEANPCTLSARSKALFGGVYKMSAGLMVRIDPRRLSPGRLAATGLFDAG
jgi:purine-binding chemotaxis protein CheW